MRVAEHYSAREAFCLARRLTSFEQVSSSSGPTFACGPLHIDLQTSRGLHAWRAHSLKNPQRRRRPRRRHLLRRSPLLPRRPRPRRCGEARATSAAPRSRTRRAPRCVGAATAGPRVLLPARSPLAADAGSARLFRRYHTFDCGQRIFLAGCDPLQAGQCPRARPATPRRMTQGWTRPCLTRQPNRGSARRPASAVAARRVVPPFFL